MTQQNKLTIGLYGFGVVGESLYKVIAQTPKLEATVKKVCIKNADKKRNAPAELFTTDRDVLLNDPDINVIIELIDDADAAYAIVTRALKNGKAVVSANKKLIATHQQELIELQERYDVPFLYEAACCASIPVVRNLEEYYNNDLLQRVSGIVNGSTNYILTKVFAEGIGFDKALSEAQAAGFAESDPSLDVNGIDAVNKLSILLTHAYGIVSPVSKLVHTGIQNLQEADARFAREKGCRIRLVAQAAKLPEGGIAAFVLPQFIKDDSQLYNVQNEFNGVVIESSLADKQFFYGKGAGGFPTASAVLSDLSALRYYYKYEYKKLREDSGAKLADDYYLKVCLSASSLDKIPYEFFEEIQEWSIDSKRCHVTGVLHISKLKEGEWWKQNGLSLILGAEGVVPFDGKKTEPSAKAIIGQFFAS